MLSCLLEVVFPLSMVLSKICAEETCLRGAGLLGVSSVLAGRVAPVLDVTSMLSRSSAQPQLVAPSNGMGRSPSGGGGGGGWGCSGPPYIQCGYFKKPGHHETDCYKKMLDMGHAPSTGTRPPPSSPSLSA
jgi:hypothetical protein